MKFDVIVMGGINVDLLVHVQQYPPYGTNVPAQSLEINVGGKGANQAVAVVKQHVCTTLIGSIGADQWGQQALDSLTQNNILPDQVVIKSTAATGTAVAVVDQTGENTLMVVLGANLALTRDDILTVMQDLEANIFLTNLETSRESVLTALQLAHKKGMYIIVDPAPASSYFPEVLQYADLVTPNKEETQQITGIPVENFAEAQKAAYLITQKGVPKAIVKLGSLGSVLYEASTQHFTIIPATPVQAVNTVGAGDTFAGVLAANLVQDPDNLVSAIKTASKAAALKVARSGGQAAIPTQEEIAQFSI